MTDIAPASETTNGSAETPAAPPAPSPLMLARQEYEKAGGKVNLKAAKSALADMQAANARAETAQAAADKAKAEAYESARKLAVATGGVEFKLGGVVYTPSSNKSGGIYYKVPTKKEVLDLG